MNIHNSALSVGGRYIFPLHFPILFYRLILFPYSEGASSGLTFNTDQDISFNNPYKYTKDEKNIFNFGGGIMYYADRQRC